MAIKGRSKSRSRRAVGRAPRPAPVVHKTPLLARRGVRRGLWVLLVLVVLGGGWRIWQNMHRADALRRYERALTRAEAPFAAHLDPSAPAGIEKLTGDFGARKVSALQFRKAAQRWEKDFTTARDAIGGLKPPRELRDAQGLFMQAIDAYSGSARLYEVAASQRVEAEKQRSIAFRAKGAEQKTLIPFARASNDQVEVLQLHAGEARQRAAALLSTAIDEMNALNRAWHVTPLLENPNTAAGGPGQVSPGAPGAPPLGVLAWFAHLSTRR